ncbi:MAG: type II toxin-antitoxin system VapC family toxin [Cyanobacteria bacterium]|nr:type II toxin-antitoxin system VapC family toxin [Cyanobacteriota bacterium]
MILCCDSSALIKLLLTEPGSDQMHQASIAAEAIVEVSQGLVETAGRFVDAFALRRYDSVQLAAAHQLHVNAEQPVVFASHDRRLTQAAQLLQLEVLP